MGGRNSNVIEICLEDILNGSEERIEMENKIKEKKRRWKRNTLEERKSNRSGGSLFSLPDYLTEQSSHP